MRKRTGSSTNGRIRRILPHSVYHNPAIVTRPPNQTHQKPFKRGQEHRDNITQLPLLPPHLNMSTEREIAEKFKEAMETRSIDVIVPYLTEDVTYDLLPSTFVVVLQSASRVLNVVMQGREEAHQG